MSSSTSNHITNVAIVGATGTVGKYITESLLAGGKHTVTAVTREGSSSKMPTGVKSAPINYDDQSSIVAALKGQDFLIITLPTTAAPGTAEKLVDAAAEAGVKWVMPNEYSPDFCGDEEFGKQSLLGPGQQERRDYLKSKGLNYIALISGFWYQYSMILTPDCYGFDFANKTMTFIDDGETKISTSTWAQSGRAVAALLSLPISSSSGPCIENYRDGPLYCHSFELSQKEMFESVLRVTGAKESDWTVKHETAQERYQRAMKELQGGDRRVGYVTGMYTPTFFKGGKGNLIEKSQNGVLGLPKEDLDEQTKIGVEMVESGWSYH